jgi:ribonuclease HI
MAKRFTCQDCGASFTVPPAALAKYPGWTPRQCSNCRSGKRAKEPALPPPLPDSVADACGVEPLVDGPSPTAKPATRTRRAPPLRGPQTGIFTDGFCEPNPGRGGWAAVRVRDGAAVEERSGAENPTTNNRMELRGLIEAFRMLDADEAGEIYSDSQYSVKTVNEWASGWEAKGWKRKGGEILNLDLVQELYALAQSRPKATLQWIRGHAGNTWNERADVLAREAADAAENVES